jgi:NAD(P)-dependent dehydrogenase (short-subunit alcohol dehydrogenase family)
LDKNEEIFMTLENRVVIITGATGVLGQLAAQEFARQGVRLVLVGTNAEKLAHLAQTLNLPDERILLHAADMSKAEQVFALAERVRQTFGRADVLLHLVGGWNGGKSVVEVDEHDIETMLQQHLWTTYHLSQAFIPLMSANHWGRILAVSSPLASRPVAGMSPYVIGKAAQEALLLTLTQEVKDSGITVNLVLVKTIDTKHERASQPTSKNAVWTTPEEITAAFLHLCSDEAGMTNGARIPLFGSF